MSKGTTMLYKHPGNMQKIDGEFFDWIIVHDDDVDAHVGKGWSKTPTEAKSKGSKTPTEAKSKGSKTPTEANTLLEDLKAMATELKIDVKHNWGAPKLTKALIEAAKELGIEAQDDWSGQQVLDALNKAKG